MKHRKPLLSFTLATLAATALLVFVPLAQAQGAPAEGAALSLKSPG